MNALQMIEQKMSEAIKSSETPMVCESMQNDEDSNPGVMDLRSVLKMLSELKVTIRDGIQEEAKKMIQQPQTNPENKILELTSRVLVCEAKERTYDRYYG